MGEEIVEGFEGEFGLDACGRVSAICPPIEWMDDSFTLLMDSPYARIDFAKMVTCTNTIS